MVSVYELQIKVDGQDCGFYCDQRFPEFPDRATIVALKNEAVATYQELHGDLVYPDVYVSVVYLSAEERKAPENAGAPV